MYHVACAVTRLYAWTGVVFEEFRAFIPNAIVCYWTASLQCSSMTRTAPAVQSLQNKRSQLTRLVSI